MKPESGPQIVSKEEILRKIDEAMQEMIAIHGVGGEEVARLREISRQLSGGELSTLDAQNALGQVLVLNRERGDVQPRQERPIDPTHNIH